MTQDALDPLDLFAVRAGLSDEERMVQDGVARFVATEVKPLIRECFEQHRFARELIPGLANLGVLGASIHGYDCAGLNAISYGLICQELERGDSALRSFVSVQSALVTACGAIKGAIDDVVLGNLTGLLARIKPAIPETKFEGEKSSKNPAYVDAVARTNVKLAIENIRRRSPVLADLEKKGSIQIVGAMYNLANGGADFVS